MKNLIPLLFATLLLQACGKEDDNDTNPSDDPNNKLSSFTLKSADNSIDISGTAKWIFATGIDTVMTISLVQENPLAECALILQSQKSVWNTDSYAHGGTNAKPTFGFLMQTVKGNYISLDGSLKITQKSTGEYIAGNLTASLWLAGESDTTDVTGTFYATQN